MVAVLGAQWGDEGKGKVVDRLAERGRIVCRYQGGHNAGHTLTLDGKTCILHLIPAGALHEQVLLAIGQGAVISPASLAAEIDALDQIGIEVLSRLLIDPRCHLVLPSHCLLDRVSEQRKTHAGGTAIGTTGRGIGPAYEDRVARRGIRTGDLTDNGLLEDRLRHLVERHNFLLQQRYEKAPLDWKEQLEELQRHAESIVPLLADVPARLIGAMGAGERVILEGAQGYLLDVDRGSYPFVTSSSTCASSALSGAGLPPAVPMQTLGIAKAYNTRVGNGPFPTELMGEQGEALQTQGRERGATTGRARRCGWLDTLLLRQAVIQNSMAGLILTKLDIFDGWPEIRMAVDYDHDGSHASWYPEDKDIRWHRMPGWEGRVAGCKRIEDLPAGARHYLDRVEELTGAPVVALSTGPDRKDWIEFTDPMEARLSTDELARRFATRNSEEQNG